MEYSVTGLDPEAVRRPWESALVVTWLPAFSMMLVSTVSYIDRNTLALLAPVILLDTHLSNQQYGLIISGFSIAYMLCNPLWGWIVDRFGVRVSMSAAVFLWTLASVSHAFAGGCRGFLAARTALGCGEGATYPGALRTVAQTLPASVRMRGTGLVYCGGSLGALLTPIVMTPVAVAWGWRATFWITGAVGALWLAMWAVLSRRRDLARPPAAALETARKPRLYDRRVWAFVAAFAMGASPLAFVLYQSSLYLNSVFHKSQIEIGHVLWLPPLAWEIGMLFWGWAMDRFGRGDIARALRRHFLGMAVLSLPLAAAPRVRSFPIALAILSFAMFIASGFTIGALAYANRRYSMNHSGLIAGLGSGSWSAVVALEMPLVGKLFDLHWYGGAFALATAFPVMGYVLWRTLDR